MFYIHCYVLYTLLCSIYIVMFYIQSLNPTGIPLVVTVSTCTAFFFTHFLIQRTCHTALHMSFGEEADWPSPFCACLINFVPVMYKILHKTQTKLTVGHFLSVYIIQSKSVLHFPGNRKTPWL